jgi:hypothetical protein
MYRQIAVKKGVSVIVKDIIWESGMAYLGKSLPVVFDAAVDSVKMDKKHLQSVLVSAFFLNKYYWTDSSINCYLI